MFGRSRKRRPLSSKAAQGETRLIIGVMWITDRHRFLPGYDNSIGKTIKFLK